MLEALRLEVWEANMDLPKNRLVTMTSGNASGRDHDSGYIVIKPSGVRYDQLKPQDLVIVDLDGNIIEGQLKPSIDTETHLAVYRSMPEVGGMVHTHSPYATSFALLGQPIPVYLTAIADEFGVAVPVGNYAGVGSDAIGREIVRSIGKSPAILMKSHGVFTIGASATAAVKAAVMVEDAAMTVHLALLRGQPEPLPDAEVERLYRQYHSKYGQ